MGSRCHTLPKKKTNHSYKKSRDDRSLSKNVIGIISSKNSANSSNATSIGIDDQEVSCMDVISLHDDAISTDSECDCDNDSGISSISSSTTPLNLSLSDEELSSRIEDDGIVIKEVDNSFTSVGLDDKSVIKEYIEKIKSEFTSRDRPKVYQEKLDKVLKARENFEKEFIKCSKGYKLYDFGKLEVIFSVLRNIGDIVFMKGSSEGFSKDINKIKKSIHIAKEEFPKLEKVEGDVNHDLENTYASLQESFDELLNAILSQLSQQQKSFFGNKIKKRILPPV